MSLDKRLTKKVVRRKNTVFVKERYGSYLNKRVCFSRHAKRQMKWREITEQEVISTIEHPVEIYETTRGRKVVIGKVHGKLLKVIYTIENDTIVVITAIDKTKR